MPVSFNPINQPNINVSDNPLADTTDIFGLRKASQAPAQPSPPPERITPFGVLGGQNTNLSKFAEGGARFKENLTTDSLQFRQRELALLKERVAAGIAGGPDISRYMVGGKGADVVQKELAAANTQNVPGIGLGTQRKMNIGQFMQTNELNRVIETEMAARVDAYIETLGNTDLDDDTRKEFLQMYQSGAQAAEISGALKRATEGVGNYGIRKSNIASRDAAMLNTATNKRQGVL